MTCHPCHPTETFFGIMPPIGNTTPSEVIKAVSLQTKVSMTNMKSKGRKGDFVAARSLAFLFLRKCTNLTLVEAGELFNRDHTTVIHSLQTIQGRIEREITIKKLYHSINLLINPYKKPVEIEEPEPEPDTPKTIKRPPSIYSNKQYY